jgi:hypothetical protein
VRLAVRFNSHTLHPAGRRADAGVSQSRKEDRFLACACKLITDKLIRETDKRNCFSRAALYLTLRG